MLFKFQKYINPVNYFNLKNKYGNTVFPKFNLLPINIQDYVEKDTQYSQPYIVELDASWQIIQKGYISNNINSIDFDLYSIPIIDEYRFLKRYYHSFWSYYVLILRLLTLNNPIVEIISFWRNLKVKRVDVYKNPIIYSEWFDFDSQLVKKSPKISVIIPTLNRYTYLKDVMVDLEKQDYKNFDVIVIDQTDPFQSEFYNQFNLDLKVEYQEEKALWLARNRAILISDADYLLFFDDDSRVETDWITNHLKALDYFNIKISSGTSISIIGAKVPQSYSYFKLSDQIDTGNVMIHRDVFKQIGLYDRQFEKQRMGDGEFGLRAYIDGYINVSNPFAQRLHLKVETGGLRQMGSWDGFRPKNWFDPRPIPSVLYFYRKYFNSKLSIFLILKTVPLSLIPYKFKNRPKFLFLGFLLFIILFPMVMLQIYKSWKLASKKIIQGPLIQKL